MASGFRVGDTLLPSEVAEAITVASGLERQLARFHQDEFDHVDGVDALDRWALGAAVGRELCFDRLLGKRK